MNRRGVGMAGIIKQKEQAEQYRHVGKARKYKKQIRNDPLFRNHFQSMCQKIGVDPLASNKGFWADLLGVGDFYYELAVRIIQFCITEKRTTGAGIIGMQEMLKKLNVAKNNREPVSEQDVEQAVKSIKIFGGFQVLVIQENGGSSNETPKKFIQSIPRELNQDIMTVFAATTELGKIDLSKLSKDHSWDAPRIQRSLNDMMKDGIIWVDQQASPLEYWLPISINI